MNRGFWLACSLALGTAFAASGCYVGPQPPPSGLRRTGPSARRGRRRDRLPDDTASRPDPGVPAARAGLRLQLGRRLLGLDRLRVELERRLLGALRPGLPLHRPALPVRRRAAGLLPALLAGSRRLPGLRLRIPRPGARGRVARAALCGARRLAWPSTTRGGGALRARGPGAARRRGVPSRCAAANPGFRGAPPAARGPAPGFHPAPAPAFHPAPAAHAAPSRGGGGGGGRPHH